MITEMDIILINLDEIRFYTMFKITNQFQLTSTTSCSNINILRAVVSLSLWTHND